MQCLFRLIKVAVLTIPTTSVIAAEPDQILTCLVHGETSYGKRELSLTVVPPESEDRGGLWVLDQKNLPKTLVDTVVGVGAIQVDYGSHQERRDLLFLTVGNSNGSSHVVLWNRDGIYSHPNMAVIDIWKENVSISVMESVEPQPFLTGTCE